MTGDLFYYPETDVLLIKWCDSRSIGKTYNRRFQFSYDNITNPYPDDFVDIIGAGIDYSSKGFRKVCGIMVYISVEYPLNERLDYYKPDPSQFNLDKVRVI